MDDSIDVSPDVTTDAHTTDGTYTNPEAAEDMGLRTRALRGDTSDEIDPRKLVRDPSLSEIRFYYRRTFASALVDKPIEDAFKNGFEFVPDDEDRSAEDARGLLENPTYKDKPGSGFVDAYIDAQIKARRDGFALVFIGTDDSTNGVHESPIGEDVAVEEVTHIKVWTIDDLQSTAQFSHEDIEKGTGLDDDQYEVRDDTGIVINTDVESPDYRTPVGYILKGGTFVHADRVLHYTWRNRVDGAYREGSVHRWDERSDTLGMWEGDSVLVPSYDLMKGVAKGNWAIMQALYRHASHMYEVTLPEDANEEDMNATVAETRNMSAKSSMVFPNGYEMEQHDSGNELDPEPYFDAIFKQICAAHEMTQSVLFGTQAGTVSGSETDIKNYFNKVERFRGQRAANDIREYLTVVKRMIDNRTEDDYEYDVPIEWGPLFKVDDQTRVQMMQTAAQSFTTLIGNYVLTPDEARSLLSSEFVQVDLDELTEAQKDELDRVVLAGMGQAEGALRSEGEYANAPDNPQASGSEGGRPEGANQSPEESGATPAEDRIIERVSDRVVEKLGEDGE